MPSEMGRTWRLMLWCKEGSWFNGFDIHIYLYNKRFAFGLLGFRVLCLAAHAKRTCYKLFWMTMGVDMEKTQ